MRIINSKNDAKKIKQKLKYIWITQLHDKLSGNVHLYLHEIIHAIWGNAEYIILRSDLDPIFQNSCYTTWNIFNLPRHWWISILIHVFSLLLVWIQSPFTPLVRLKSFKVNGKKWVQSKQVNESFRLSRIKKSQNNYNIELVFSSSSLWNYF